MAMVNRLATNSADLLTRWALNSDTMLAKVVADGAAADPARRESAAARMLARMLARAKAMIWTPRNRARILRLISSCLRNYSKRLESRRQKLWTKGGFRG